MNRESTDITTAILRLARQACTRYSDEYFFVGDAIAYILIGDAYSSDTPPSLREVSYE